MIPALAPRAILGRPVAFPAAGRDADLPPPDRVGERLDRPGTAAHRVRGAERRPAGLRAGDGTICGGSARTIAAGGFRSGLSGFALRIVPGADPAGWRRAAAESSPASRPG